MKRFFRFCAIVFSAGFWAIFSVAASAEERPVLTQEMALAGLGACAEQQAENTEWAPMGVVIIDRHLNIVGAMRPRRCFAVHDDRSRAQSPRLGGFRDSV